MGSSGVLSSPVAILVMELVAGTGKRCLCTAGHHKLFKPEMEWDTCSVPTFFSFWGGPPFSSYD
jgi:hypothetical protein